MNNFDAVTQDNPNIDYEYPTKIEAFTFLSEGEKIIGTFFRSSGKEKKPTVFLLHGLPGNENNFDIAHAIERFGYNAIIFHYRGSWGSGGAFSISNALQDVKNAIKFFSEDEIANNFNIDKDNIILIGHSMGGFLAMLASIEFPQIKHVGFLSGFNFGFFANFILNNPEHQEITMNGLAQGSEILWNTSGEKLYNEMIEKKNEWNLLDKTNQISKKNVLMIGAKFDFVAPLELHHNIILEALQKSGCNVKGVILNSGHSFTSMRIGLIREVINWLEINTNAYGDKPKI